MGEMERRVEGRSGQEFLEESEKKLEEMRGSKEAMEEREGEKGVTARPAQAPTGCQAWAGPSPCRDGSSHQLLSTTLQGRS